MKGIIERERKYKKGSSVSVPKKKLETSSDRTNDAGRGATSSTFCYVAPTTFAGGAFGAMTIADVVHLGNFNEKSVGTVSIVF